VTRLTPYRTTWLARPASPVAAGRVFCIPYAGCGASLFRGWPRAHDGVEFLPVELPGRETRLREPIPDTFEELGRALADALEPYLDIPFAFFGHCWSALLAYEVSAQLQRAGGPVSRRLYVSSMVAPQHGPLSRLLGESDAVLRAELEGTIRALGGQPHPDLVSVYVDVLRADVAAGGRYVVPEPTRLACPVTAIGWTDDTEIRPDRMNGWSECGDTTFEVFAGRHHRFVDAPAELLATLSSGLRTDGGDRVRP
jgi:surfactin synthase thioesterase subunit